MTTSRVFYNKLAKFDIDSIDIMILQWYIYCVKNDMDRLDKGGESMTGLKNIRKTKGLTQENVSSLANVPLRTISRWEAGKTTPSVKTLVKVAKGLGCSTDELLGVNNEKGEIAK